MPDRSSRCDEMTEEQIREKIKEFKNKIFKMSEQSIFEWPLIMVRQGDWIFPGQIQHFDARLGRPFCWHPVNLGKACRLAGNNSY
jgi:hypothetical protein